MEGETLLENEVGYAQLKDKTEERSGENYKAGSISGRQAEQQTKASTLWKEGEEVPEHEEEHHENAALQFFEWICYPLLWLIDKIMPVQTLPELAFFVIVCLYFVSTDYILKIVDVLSIYINLPHIFVGITIMSWGSCAVELINMSIAAKKNEFQLGITSILSALVFAFLLLIPLSITAKILKRDSH